MISAAAHVAIIEIERRRARVRALPSRASSLHGSPATWHSDCCFVREYSTTLYVYCVGFSIGQADFPPSRGHPHDASTARAHATPVTSQPACHQTSVEGAGALAAQQRSRCHVPGPAVNLRAIKTLTHALSYPWAVANF
jgi:hypothetical protein